VAEKRSAEARMLREAHEQARALYRVGAIDAITMREFDALCVKPVRKYKPAQIRRIRAWPVPTLGPNRVIRQK